MEGRKRYGRRGRRHPCEYTGASGPSAGEINFDPKLRRGPCTWESPKDVGGHLTSGSAATATGQFTRHCELLFTCRAGRRRRRWAFRGLPEGGRHLGRRYSRPPPPPPNLSAPSSGGPRRNLSPLVPAELKVHAGFMKAEMRGGPHSLRHQSLLPRSARGMRR